MEKAVAILSLEKVKEASAELKADGVEAEQIRSNLERCLRLKAFSIGVQSIQDVDAFLQFAVSLAKEEMCSKTLAVQLLQDLFDVNSIKRCEELFDILENSISVFKTPFFFDSCKNMILRMCNDLLKRLSRTVDTSFCGRILILLARSLPLNEKSGLNLPGQFNVANLTSYEKQEKQVEKTEEAEEDTEMEVGEIRDTKDAAVNFDYGLYTKFWEIQSFFCNPNSVYETASFNKFETLLSDALNVFSTYKLERPGSKAQLKERSISTSAQNGTTTFNGFCKVKSEESVDQKPSCSTCAKEDNFFAKYLTNQKLFNLQLADSQFRRYFLIQALILTNYLLNKPKLKENFNNLTQNQENYLKEVMDKCHTLLKETYPQGAHFADSVRRTLAREKMWSNWKSEGCPDLIASLIDSKTQLFKKRPVKRYDPATLDLGNKELTRLWNIAPDNLSACMAKTRNCVPQLKQFIDDGLDELDPSQKVEELYRSVNDEKYQWMASRFLLYNSDHYMNCVNTDPKAPRQTTAKFLEKAIQMTALFMPELKGKAEGIQSAIAKKEADERAEILRVAEEQKAKLREEEDAETEAAMRRFIEEDQKKKKLEEEKKRKAQEEEKSRQEEDRKHRLVEEEQKRRQLIESHERRKQESQNRKLLVVEDNAKIKTVKEEPKEVKRKSEETTKRRVKIPEEKSPQQPQPAKEKEKHIEVEKHEIVIPSPKAVSKSKRSSNADTPSSIDDRDISPAVPPKKLREENSYKRTKDLRQTINNSQSTPTTSSHTRRSNGQESVKHASSRNDKKKL